MIDKETHEILLKDARDLVMTVFNQACQYSWNKEKDWAEFDHLCISAYQEAQDKLLEWGMIKPEQCLRG